RPPRIRVFPYTTLFRSLSAVATGACLWSNRALDYVVKHPVLVLIDLLLVVGMIAGVGIDNPLVLAAYPTAFYIGLLTPTINPTTDRKSTRLNSSDVSIS